jgi:4-amino-4-deoxy-L-arabinose transferase-like glycosyltransferase
MDIAINTVNNKSNTIQKILAGFGLLTAILAMRVFTLGLYPLYDPSESRYAEMGRKMLETQNWVTPLIDYGVPFWGKPPLTVWMTASSLWLGGDNEFFARLPSFILSVAMAWIVFYVANRQSGYPKARNSVIILGSTVLFFVMSGTVAMDVALSFGITLALAAFWLALRENKAFWGYLFFVGLSIGLLAKGPVTLVLTGITIGLWVTITGEWLKIWQRIPWITGTLLMLCISVPWYLIAEQKTPGFLEYFFIGEHWKRFTVHEWQGDLYGHGHGRPRGIIWLFWLIAAFPWSLIFIKIIVTALMKKQPSKLLQSDHSWRLYCLLWMLAPLIFFTFSANLIWTYALPALPGFALLLSEWLENSKYRTALALCVPTSFLALVIACQFPNVDFLASQKSLVTAYEQAALPKEQLIYFMDRPYSAEFYLQGQAGFQTDIAQLENSLLSPERHFYVFRKESVNELPEAIGARLDIIKDYGAYALFHDNGREQQWSVMNQLLHKH